MSFLRSFADELVKTAGPGRRFGRMMRAMRVGEHAGEAAAHRGMGLGRAALLTGGAGAGAGVLGEVYGKKKGKQKGYDEGTSDVSEVAQRAREVGREEGVMAYHQALQARLKRGG